MIDLLRTSKHLVTRTYSRLRRGITGRGYRQLVVCGYPRGGTSLLYNMLSTTLESFSFEHFEVPAARRIHRLGDIASKFPLDVLDVRDLPSLNIHGKEIIVIGVVRDPRDVMTSRHPVVPDRYFIGHDHSWWPQDVEFREWKFDAPGIMPVFEAMVALEVSSPFRYLSVRYEDLVADADAVQTAIGEALGLRFNGRFSSFHQRGDRLAYRYQGAASPRDPSLVREDKAPDASRAGKWRDATHRARIVEQFQACPKLFAVLEHHGYEADDGWFAAYRDQ